MNAYIYNNCMQYPTCHKDCEGEKMQQIIGGEKYDTETADLVGSDLYWDGHNWQRYGVNTYLYKTKNGVFFLHKTTIWQGEGASIEVVSVDEAKDWYGRLPESKMGYKDAFGMDLVEA